MRERKYKTPEEFDAMVDLYVAQCEAVRDPQTGLLRETPNLPGLAGAGPIFLLKNMGYTDRHDHRIDPVTVRIEGKMSKL